MDNLTFCGVELYKIIKKEVGQHFDSQKYILPYHFKDFRSIPPSTKSSYVAI